MILTEIWTDLFPIFGKKYDATKETTNNYVTKFFSEKGRQNLGAAGPLLLTIGVGMTIGYSAILLPELEPSKNGTVTATSEQSSWIASLAALPQSVAALLGGYLIEKYGRKSAHMLTCLPSFIGWMIIYFATNVEMLMVARFITGFCAGILAPASGVYIGEISEPKYRGLLLGGISLSVSGGLLFSHLLGTFLTWQNTALIASVVSLAAFFIMLLAPESPSWLMKKGKLERAEKSFFWFRGQSDEAKKELQSMMETQNTSQNIETSFKAKIDILLKQEFLKPIGIITGFFIFSQWAGPNAINYYSVTIMKQTLGNGVNEYLATFIVDIIRIFSSVSGCVIMKKFKRRPLAMFSGVGSFISLSLLSGLTFGAKSYPSISQDLSFASIVAIIAYIIFITVGFVTMQWSLLGELLPLAGRSVGSGIGAFVAFFTTFTVVKTTPWMFETLKPEGTFLVFGVNALIATVFLYFFYPETKNKTLGEIEEHFRGYKNNFELTKISREKS